MKEANIRQIQLWKSDSWESVECYNNWFMEYAPHAFRSARKGVMEEVVRAFKLTDDLTDLSVEALLKAPSIISVLRMVTAPPLAQDRLIGLSRTSRHLLKTLESGKMTHGEDREAIARLLMPIKKMLDKDIFPWLEGKPITPQQRKRSASIIADRVTGVLSDPIIRNAQEQRQFKVVSEYLTRNGYIHLRKVEDFREMPSLTYAFHVNVPVTHGEDNLINLPVDIVIQPKDKSGFPLLVECKSAGDFANTNKRRKEEAMKFSQLKQTYGPDITLCLFLCGYFDTGYLGYEAAEGIDWVWEHRVDDFIKLGV